MTRLQALQASLISENLDALILTSPTARRYITGFPSSAGLALITPGECFFFTDFRYIEAAQAQVRGLTVRLSTRDESARKQAIDILRDLNAADIGFEADAMTAAEREDWERLWRQTSAATDLRLRPAQELPHSLRLRKDADELAAIEAAQRIAERALSEVVGQVLRSGLTERQVCAELVYRLHLYGADGPSFPPIVASGPHSALPHAQPGDRALQRGDCVILDMGASLDGYCSDMTRTVFLGKVSDEQRRVYDAVLRAQTAGIAAVKAGAAGREIDAAARQVIADAGHGDHFGHGFGHGVGLEVHERPGVNPSGETPIPAGAVITAEPGIYLPGQFGVRIEDLLVVTETGSRNLTEMAKELRIIQ